MCTLESGVSMQPMLLLHMQFKPVVTYETDSMNVTRYAGYGIDIFNIIASALNFR